MKEKQACSATYKTLPPILKSSSSKGTKTRCHKTAKLKVYGTINTRRLCSDTAKPLLLKDTTFPKSLTKFHTTGMARSILPRAVAKYFGIHTPFTSSIYPACNLYSWAAMAAATAVADRAWA